MNLLKHIVNFIRKFEDIRGVIRTRKSKDIQFIMAKKKRSKGQYNGQKKKRTKGQAMIYKILHRKLKIKQHDSH